MISFFNNWWGRQNLLLALHGILPKPVEFIKWKYMTNLCPYGCCYNAWPTQCNHYDDVIMSTIASQITSLTIVYSIVYPGADQSKHQSSASLAFVWGIHRGPVNSPHKWPVTRKMFPFDDVIMINMYLAKFFPSILCNIYLSANLPSIYQCRLPACPHSVSDSNYGI